MSSVSEDAGLFQLSFRHNLSSEDKFRYTVLTEEQRQHLTQSAARLEKPTRKKIYHQK